MKFPWDKEEKVEDKKEDIEIKPEDLKNGLTEIGNLKTTVAGFGEKLKGLDAVTAYVARQEKEATDRKAAADKTTKDEAVAAADADLDIFTDPASAIRGLISKEVAPLVTNAIQQTARQNAIEFFQNDARFEYFDDPTFKQEVMRNILSLPPNQMNNTDSFENCYHVVAGRKAVEIKE